MIAETDEVKTEPDAGSEAGREAEKTGLVTFVTKPCDGPEKDSLTFALEKKQKEVENDPLVTFVTKSCDVLAETLKGSMTEGESRFGITCTGAPVGRTHWLADSSVCGDMVMALPSSVLIAGRTKEAGGVAVDVAMFLDAIVEGAAKLEGLVGVAEAASLPSWAVSRLFGTFPVLMAVYHEAIDQAVLTVEAAAMKAAIGMHVATSRKFRKHRETPQGSFTDEVEESSEKYFPPDAALSKTILTSRMRGRYKDEGGVKQAIQINISGAEANL